MRAMEISRTGLDVEWQRLQVIAQNLANVNTTRTGGGDVYRPMRLVSGPESGFSALLSGGSAAKGAGVRVLGIEAAPGNVRRVYEPGHPDAGADGFVTYPAIDHAGEMTLLVKTSRAYEANLTAMNLAHQMYSRALDLGRQS
jgi:flagellar basal-body rod protein FlgC